MTADTPREPADLVVRLSSASDRLHTNLHGHIDSISGEDLDDLLTEAVAALREARAAGLREAPELREALGKAALWILQLGVPAAYETWRPEYNSLLDTIDRALLAAPEAAPAEGRALDVAWARCEEALPDGREWTISVRHAAGGYEADVELDDDDPDSADNPFVGPLLDDPRSGDTPAAALEALADALAAPAEPATEGEAG